MQYLKYAIALLATAIIVPSAMSESTPDPVVGGALLAVNVEVVATTGYRASKLLGGDVYNDQDEKIGKVDDFIVGSDSKVSVAVISVGGFLGMGSRLVAVPAALFQSDEKGRTILNGATRKELEALPEFQYVK